MVAVVAHIWSIERRRFPHLFCNPHPSEVSPPSSQTLCPEVLRPLNPKAVRPQAMNLKPKIRLAFADLQFQNQTYRKTKHETEDVDTALAHWKSFSIQPVRPGTSTGSANAKRSSRMCGNVIFLAEECGNPSRIQTNEAGSSVSDREASEAVVTQVLA